MKRICAQHGSQQRNVECVDPLLRIFYKLVQAVLSRVFYGYLEKIRLQVQVRIGQTSQGSIAAPEPKNYENLEHTGYRSYVE